MANCPSSLVLTELTEPASKVTQTLPTGFDPIIAYLLGQCCSLTYVQFDAGLNWSPDFSGLTLPGYTVAASSSATQFSVYEANEPGPTAGDTGDYYQVPAGFAVQLQLTPTGSGTAQSLVVIALRGTRTWAEWFGNADAFPTAFAGTGELSEGLGTVHAGFYGDYTMGQNGAVVSNALNPTWSERAAGSIAAQVGEYVSQLAGTLPVYVTGHSLGGALATLCALDIAYNFNGKFSTLYMYSLASPRVAVGISDIPTLDNQNLLLANYQKYVPNSYQIVHAADIVPILGPLSLSLGPLTLSCAQITAQYQLGSGATGTASISGGGVSGVTVPWFNGSGYDSSFPPQVAFSGGRGSGATAQASIDGVGYVSEITVTNAGTGYTSAPTVEIISTGPALETVVNFCAQTGDIVGNHACVISYVPYLAQLAVNFAGC